jgi:hypothetical protein
MKADQQDESRGECPEHDGEQRPGAETQRGSTRNSSAAPPLDGAAHLKSAERACGHMDVMVNGMAGRIDRLTNGGSISGIDAREFRAH